MGHLDPVNDQEQVLGDSGDEDDEELDDDDVEFGEEALLLKNRDEFPKNSSSRKIYCPRLF